MPTRRNPLVLLLLAFGGLAFSGSSRASAQAVAEVPGPLMLIGGRHQDLSKELRDVFFDLAGGIKAKIVVIPTATAEDDPKKLDLLLTSWRELMPLSVQILHTRDRKTADDPAFVKPLTEATAVFITNGHPDRIFNSYRGTLVEKELKKLRARGGFIGGTGTGMSVLGDFVHWHTAPGFEPGLGLLTGFVADDPRDERLSAAIDANPAQVGLGIEPSTALVIRGNDMRVIGERTVKVYLAKGANQEAKIDTFKSGDRLDVAELRRAAAQRVPLEKAATAPAAVVRDKVAGAIAHGSGNTRWDRIIGKVKVLDARTLEFADGTRVELDIHSPALEQLAMHGETFYPCGREAAEFLRTMIGDQTVTAYYDGPGRAYVGDVGVEHALVVNGWALADHSSLHAAEIIARENKRGLWRGPFVIPDEWRNGKRLPGEDQAAKSPKVTAVAQAPPTVKWDRIRGGINFPEQKREWLRITGKVDVLAPHLVRFADGTEASLLWNMSSPGADQQFHVGDSLLPAGRESTEFLRKLIGDREVTFTVHPDAREGNKVRGVGFVGEMSLAIEMIRNGWGFSDHEGMDPWEVIAREQKRGMWRGEFIPPRRWHQGERLRGEEPAAKSVAAATPQSNDPSAILGRWNALDRHAAMGSLFQPVHAVRKRESVVDFEQAGETISAHAIKADHKAISNQERWKDGRTELRNVRFVSNQLTFDFPVGEWFPVAGPIAIEDKRLENRGTIRVDAKLHGNRLIGRWRMFLVDETEIFRGEWEATRVPEKK